MDTLLPETLKIFVHQQVASRGDGTSSAYDRELIRKDHDVQKLRALLFDDAGSVPAAQACTRYIQQAAS
jgi:antitoxin ParD1/3/4